MSVYFVFFQSYLLFSVFIYLTALLGFVIWQCLPVKNAQPHKVQSLFYSLLLGICIIVVFFSLYITVFKTINIVFLLMGALLIWRYYNKEFVLPKSLWANILAFSKAHYLKILLYSIPFIAFEALFYFNHTGFKYVIPFVDYIDMYNISQVITLTGQENNKYLLSNFYYPQFHGVAPYHFFELWTNGFLSSILPLPGTLTLMLFVYPFFYFTSFVGVLALWEHYGRLNTQKVILSFFILFVGGMFFEFYKNYELLKWYGGNVGNIVHIWGKKAAVLYPFIIAALIAFARAKQALFVVLMLCMGVVAIGVMPGIAGGLFLFLLLNKWHKALNRKDLNFSFLVYLIFILSFMGVFLFFGNKNEDSLGFTAILSDLFNALDADYLKTIFFRVIFPALRLIVIFSPFLVFVIYALYRLKKGKHDYLGLLFKGLLLVTLILFVGNITGAVASINIFSGGQFFSYLFPLLIVYIIFAFVVFYSTFPLYPLNKKTVMPLVFLIFFLTACTYNIYNNVKMHKHYKNVSLSMYGDTYIQNITTYLNAKNLNPLGVSFLGQEDIQQYPLNAYGITGLTFTGMSVKLTEEFHATSLLSIFELNLDTSSRFASALLKSFEFYNFVQKQKSKGHFAGYEQAKVDFIEHFGIDYALVYKNAQLPAALNKRIKKEFRDSVSGQRFVVFY